MSLTVAPTVHRGSAPLQPFYYSSSLFVDPMRDDIASLLVAFATAYTRDPFEPDKPFELFKTVWKEQGWDLAHLKVLDARARLVFLQNVMRLFVERMEPVEHLLTRVGALFGLYTFYMVQPESSQPAFKAIEYITMTIDAYEQLLAFPGALHPPLRSYVTHIISQLLSLEVFHIIPHSSLRAYNPRTLPHTIQLLTQNIDIGPRKKTGRPSQVELSQRAEHAISELETFIQSSPLEPPSPNEYLALKEQLRSKVSSEALQAAEAMTMERIDAAHEHVRDKYTPMVGQEGLDRLKGTLDQSNGLLGLLKKDT